MGSGKSRFRYVVGIDESGRGPLAGPVSVAAVAIEKHGLFHPLLEEAKDSKQLSAQKRRIIFGHIKEARAAGDVTYAFASVGPSCIDEWGIERAVSRATDRVLRRLALIPEETVVLLDGGLRAPRQYASQTTIIRGDEKEPLIALASIVAKVLRDAKMERIALKYPGYRLEQHKGYGTKEHFKLIRRLKASPVHRLSYLKNVRAG